MEIVILFTGLATVAFLLYQFWSGRRQASTTHVSFHCFPFHFKGKALSPSQIKETKQEIEELKAIDKTTIKPMMVSEYFKHNAELYKEQLKREGIVESHIVDNLKDYDFRIDHEREFHEYCTGDIGCKKPINFSIQPYPSQVVGRIGPSEYPKLTAIKAGTSTLPPSLAREDSLAYYHLSCSFSLTDEKMKEIGVRIAELFKKEGDWKTGWEMFIEIRRLSKLGAKNSLERNERFSNLVLSQLTKASIGKQIFVLSKRKPYAIVSNLFGPMVAYSLDEFIDVVRIDFIKNNYSGKSWVFSTDEEVYDEAVKLVGTVSVIDLPGDSVKILQANKH